MVANFSNIVRPALFSIAALLTGCVGYAQPVGPAYGPVYGGPAYVAPPIVVAPPPVVVPIAPRPFWYAPGPRFYYPGYRGWGYGQGRGHGHHHRDRD